MSYCKKGYIKMNLNISTKNYNLEAFYKVILEKYFISSKACK